MLNKNSSAASTQTEKCSSMLLPNCISCVPFFLIILEIFLNNFQNQFISNQPMNVCICPLSNRNV
jgi:hypothetical protein